jgi:hypothetical protein
MSLSFMTPAKAQKTIDTLPGNMTSSKVQALAQDFKSAKNTTDVASIANSYSDGTEAGVNIPKPSGYTPLTIEQREDWNKYLEFLGNKAGSPELDKGVPSKGRQLLSAYLKDNPNSSLNDFSDQDNLVKSIQYEMQVMRKGNNGSDIGLKDPNELKAMQDLLSIQRKPWMSVDLSKMDGNPGQYTTLGYYPKFGNTVDYKQAIGKIYNTLKFEKDKLKK